MVLLQASAMREGSTPGDSLHPWIQSMFADATTLALMRLKRTGTLSDSDQATLRDLLELLENTQEGEEAIALMSAGLWPVVSSESVGAFRVVLSILPRLGVQAEDIGSFLERLHATVQALLDGAVPSNQDLDSLRSFLTSYGWYWKQELPRTGC